MLLLKSDGRRREKLGILWLGVGHGRATTGTGRAKLLELWVFSKAWAGTAVPLQARPCHCRHGRAKLLAS